MNRKDTTRFLSELLVKDRFGGRKYWASEISLDYGTKDVKRVDFMQFEPEGVIHVSDIEKGIFTCYEVKSCKEDVFSGNGLNFVAEKNYIVATMQCYKDILPDMRSGKLRDHIRKCNPESSANYGVIVPIPRYRDMYDEYEKPTPLDKETEWEMKVIFSCNQGRRERPMVELLFCMLRSGH